MTEKIKGNHLARKAMLYVRQSSPRQVSENEESRRLQYAMERRLRELGWRSIEIVDDDLGRSAAGTTERRGFERMVAEVCLGKVGAVAARELSRFARNSRDWQQLIEVCRVVDTLLIDHETIYDSRRSNDRLLLGLKGTLNEYELDVLRLRASEARNEKARRGELMMNLPVGYIRTDDQCIAMDPDRRVQEVLRLMFKKVLEVGSARQATLWFIEHGVELPIRHFGAAGWETVWKRADYRVLLRALRNPIYAGAYSFGRRQVTSEFREGQVRKKRESKPMESWIALIYDHHEAYVDREEFERVQRMISKNTSRSLNATPGAAKKGSALLAGLLRCWRCGRKLRVGYSGRNHTVIVYSCPRGCDDPTEPSCIRFGGRVLDEAISCEVLRVVEPAGIEAAALAAQEASDEQDDVITALRLELEQARYAADRAQRQYDVVDPANRLVAGELEHRWNAALKKAEELEARIAQEDSRRKRCLPSGVDTLTELSEDLHRVWNDPNTDVRLKKRILRTLIEEVIVDLDDETREIVAVTHWKGGIHAELRLKRPGRKDSGAHNSTEAVEAVEVLALILDDQQIAAFLNRGGLRTGRGNRWTKERVYSLRNVRDIPKYSRERQEEEGWLNLTDAAAYIGIDRRTLRRAAERGEVEVKHPLPNGPWIFKRENIEAKYSVNKPAGPAAQQLTLFDETT